MIKVLPFLIIIFSFGHCFSQSTFEIELDSVQSEIDAKKFIEENKSRKGKIVIFNTEKHHTRLANDLYDLSVGGKKIYETDINRTTYKILDKKSTPHYRMSYILLDNKGLSIAEMNKLKLTIVTKYKRGYRFEDLASQYSMDHSAYTGGDSGWVTEGSFFPEVENEIWGNQGTSDEIFSVDVPSQNYTFLILNTHSAKDIEEVKVLKMTEETR